MKQSRMGIFNAGNRFHGANQNGIFFTPLSHDKIVLHYHDDHTPLIHCLRLIFFFSALHFYSGWYFREAARGESIFLDNLWIMSVKVVVWMWSLFGCLLCSFCLSFHALSIWKIFGPDFWMDWFMPHRIKVSQTCKREGFRIKQQPEKRKQTTTTISKKEIDNRKKNEKWNE